MTMADAIMFPRYPNCEKCDLWDYPRTVGMATHWLATSQPPLPGRDATVVVGQNPGVQEDLAQVPFVGPSGRIMKEAYLGGINLHGRTSVYLTNAVRCHTEANEKPSLSCAKACAPYTVHDLKLIQEAHTDGRIIVLCLGAPAVESFFKYVVGLKGAASLRTGFERNGQPYEVGDITVNFFCTYHPAYLMRDGKHIAAVHDHMQLVLDFLDDVSAQPTEPHVIPVRPPLTGE